MKIIKFICSIMLIFLCVNISNAKQVKRIAILDFTANNISESNASVVRNRVELVLYRAQKFDILEREKVKIILREQNIASIKCEDTVCAVEIGEFISADYIIIGSYDFLDKHIINIRVVDVLQGKIVYADAGSKLTQKDILDIATELARNVADFITHPQKEKAIPSSKNNENNYFNNFFWSVNVGYIQPINTFYDITYSGIDFMISAGIENIFINNFSISANSGAGWLPTKEDNGYILLIPINLEFYYSITINSTLHFLPLISSGTSYVTHKNNDFSDSKFEPVLNFGFKLKYFINKSYSICAGLTYNNIFEESGSVEYFVINIGLIF